MNILLWRNWVPLYSYPATFSSLSKYSIGGTCCQLLWHAKKLIEIGHSVQVLGVSREDILEEGVDFVGAVDRDEQGKSLHSGRIRPPDVILLEGAFAAAEWLKTIFPRAKLIHIGQNIDRYGHLKALKIEKAIDAYAFVSPGHHADYCIRYPRFRHKFFMIRNVVPWFRLYSNVTIKPVEDTIAWVGAWTKKGLRQWAETVQLVLRKFPSYRWILYGPNHGTHIGEISPDIFSRLNFRDGSVSIKSLPLIELAQEISSARILLVSLGHGTACISALDAHEMGRPVISGNDIVFKYNNPEGTGIRAFYDNERFNAIVRLLGDPELCDRLGDIGRRMIISDYTEINQENDLKLVLNYLGIVDRIGQVATHFPPGDWAMEFSDWSDRIKRKIRQYRIA